MRDHENNGTRVSHRPGVRRAITVVMMLIDAVSSDTITSASAT